MVCYSSITPLPSLASILCSSSASFNFYALLFFFLCTTLTIFIFSSSFYAMCFLFILFIVPLISTSDSPQCIILPTCLILQKMLCLFSILHVIHTSRRLPNHHTNSSYSLAIIQGSLASLAVILRIFFFSVSRDSSSSLVVIVRQFWLLWLPSLFLLVTFGGDLGPITSGLCILGHLS
jgi:hypothetical protein